MNTPSASFLTLALGLGSAAASAAQDQTLARSSPRGDERVPIHTAAADRGFAYGIWAAGERYKASFRVRALSRSRIPGAGRSALAHRNRAGRRTVAVDAGAELRARDPSRRVRPRRRGRGLRRARRRARADLRAAAAAGGERGPRDPRSRRVDAEGRRAGCSTRCGRLRRRGGAADRALRRGDGDRRARGDGTDDDRDRRRSRRAATRRGLAGDGRVPLGGRPAAGHHLLQLLGQRSWRDRSAARRAGQLGPGLALRRTLGLGNRLRSADPAHG